MRNRLIKRFTYLYSGEAMSVVMFIVVAVLLNRVTPQLRLFSLPSFWISFALLEFLLVQGSVYWHVKWKKLKRENITAMPAHVIISFQKLKTVNWTLLLVALVIFAVDIFTRYPSLPIGSLGFTGFVYLFAVVEYINYFHYQLTYRKLSEIHYILRTKKLKQSCISRDFDKLI